MKVLRIYIENSVIGGYFDDEFKEITHKLFDHFRSGVIKPIISSHVIAELENGAPYCHSDSDRGRCINKLEFQAYCKPK